MFSVYCANIFGVGFAGCSCWSESRAEPRPGTGEGRCRRALWNLWDWWGLWVLLNLWDMRTSCALGSRLTLPRNSLADEAPA